MMPTQFGRYQITAELGRGGMATIYQAHDPRFQRAVAIKVLPPQFLHDPTFSARFRREAQIIASLEHPAIVPVYDFGEEAGQPYLVMRFLPGGTLSDRLKQGALSLPEAARIFSRLGPALDEAHARGIVHRDLKPANILFDGHGEAYLTDFGIARLAEATSALTGSTVVGTPAYMSPEQARGDPELDGRSDVYALGAILFEMLSGEQPYQATTPMGVALKHLTDPVPRLREVNSDLPPACEALIAKAMAKEPSERFASAGELAAALEALARQPAPEPVRSHSPQEQPVSPAPPVEKKTSSVQQSPRSQGAPVPTAMRPPRRPAWIWLVGGLVAWGVLCGVAGLVWAGSTMVRETQSQARAPLSAITPDEPSPGSTPRPVEETSLFRDDFSNPESGWQRSREAGGVMDYDGGGYRILVDQPDTTFWTTAGLSFSDVILEVDAEKIAGSDDNYFGLVCRYQDQGNFYIFLVSSDGYYSIGKFKNGEFISIEEAGQGYSRLIHQGKTVNRLRADCIGSSLSLYANDSRLATVEDNDFTSGDVGLTATAFQIAGTNILFDNFVAQKP